MEEPYQGVREYSKPEHRQLAASHSSQFGSYRISQIASQASPLYVPSQPSLPLLPYALVRFCALAVQTNQHPCAPFGPHKSARFRSSAPAPRQHARQPQPARCRYSLRQLPCQRRNRPPALNHRVQEPARQFASPLLNVIAKKGGAIWPRLFCTHSTNWLTGLSAYPWPKPVRASSFAAFQRPALRSGGYVPGSHYTACSALPASAPSRPGDAG